MNKYLLLTLATLLSTLTYSQQADQLINVREVERIEKTLSSDEMEGRATFKRGNDKAAAFIAEEFAKAGLQTWNNSGSFLQPFSTIRSKFISAAVTFDGVPVESRDVIVFTSSPDISFTEKSGYEKVTMPAGGNLFTLARKFIGSGKNLLVLVDTSYGRSFNNLLRLKSNSFKSDNNVVFVITTLNPAAYTVSAKHEITEQKLQNVVGIIPGKSRKNEYVIFSGHYDHLGIVTKDRQGNVLTDSIFNGANDDAAGTTAVIMLAKYFKALNNNERTLVFAAFTAEEIGGYGSQYFSRQFNAEAVKAMFNIEMIGTESKWGKNSAYITGYEKTDMGKLLQGNLENTGFTFYPDPYTKENLFYRSDNATLARLGVPAHTISTSKMDSEPNYHKASDEFGTLDMENMTMIIKAIALSSRGIISGKETPSRVDTSTLN
jgi:hypothetical protein